MSHYRATRIVCQLCQLHVLRVVNVSRSILEMLVAPLQERMDDWKKVAVQLDKEHGKGMYAKAAFTAHELN